MTDNIKMAVNGYKLTLEIDLDRDYGPSSSGKTIIIASTQGAAKVPGHGGVGIGLNIYRKSK